MIKLYFKMNIFYSKNVNKHIDKIYFTFFDVISVFCFGVNFKQINTFVKVSELHYCDCKCVYSVRTLWTNYEGINNLMLFKKPLLSTRRLSFDYMYSYTTIKSNEWMYFERLYEILFELYLCFHSYTCMTYLISHFMIYLMT